MRCFRLRLMDWVRWDVKNVVMAIFIFGHSPLPFSDFMHTRRVHSRGIFNASRQVTSRHVASRRPCPIPIVSSHWILLLPLFCYVRERSDWTIERCSPCKLTGCASTVLLLLASFLVLAVSVVSMVSAGGCRDSFMCMVWPPSSHYSFIHSLIRNLS